MTGPFGVRELLRRYLLGEPTFRQILATVYEQGRSLPDSFPEWVMVLPFRCAPRQDSDDELDAFFDKERDKA